MAVRLRLQRGGAKKRPFYRVVAADRRRARDGKFIELLGTFDPLQEPPAIRLNKERVDYWIGVGALPSDTVKSIIAKIDAGEGIDLSKEGADKAAVKARREAREAEKTARKAAVENAAAEKAAEAAKAAKAAEAAAAEAKAAEEAAAAEAAAEEAPAEEAAAEEAPAEEAAAEEAPAEEPAAEEAKAEEE